MPLFELFGALLEEGLKHVRFKSNQRRTAQRRIDQVQMTGHREQETKIRMTVSLENGNSAYWLKNEQEESGETSFVASVTNVIWTRASPTER